MRIRSGRTVVPIAALVVLAAVVHPPPAVAQEEVVEEEISSEYQTFRLVRVAANLERPWAIAFLDDDRILVTERPGRMQLIRSGQKTEISGLPEVHAQNQGGLLDVVAHPRFGENGWIYFTYSKGDSEGTVPALARARLDGTRLVDLEELFESNTYTSPGRHYGSRILFLQDGTLLMTIGDRGATPERAQNPADHSGSVLRLNEDGSVPPDNPFVGDPARADEIYSYGLRNVQGIVRHPITGAVWATDHGARGSDLLHKIEPGKNYGWPEVTLSRDYRTQEPFGERREYGEEMREPVFEFLPTLAPSGLAVVQGGAWDDRWQGNLLAGGLRAQRIMRLVIENDEVVHAEELLLRQIGRIRDVRQGPDGQIYIAVDAEEGAVYRIEPAG